MTDEIKVCSVPVFSDLTESRASYLLAPTAYLWEIGRTLRVRFLDGDSVVQGKVEAIAHQWSQFANIKFQFGKDPDAEIRISFTQPGSWSILGTAALQIPKSEPTMNFGWLKPDSPDEDYSSVVLHEFGHALGFNHEHQHPDSGIKWNRAAVIDYFRRTNGWDESKTTTNVLQAESKNATQYSAFDRDSIMLYPIPAQLTTDGFSTDWNTQLSATDKQFAQVLYPKTPLGERNTILYIAPFDGRTFGSPTATHVVSGWDGWRGWSWDGKRASYLAVNNKRETILYIAPFDGRTFGSPTASQIVSSSDGWRGWSWDGKRASYLAVQYK